MRASSSLIASQIQPFLAAFIFLISFILFSFGPKVHNYKPPTFQLPHFLFMMIIWDQTERGEWSEQIQVWYKPACHNHFGQFYPFFTRPINDLPASPIEAQPAGQAESGWTFQGQKFPSAECWWPRWVGLPLPVRRSWMPREPITTTTTTQFRYFEGFLQEISDDGSEVSVPVNVNVIWI